MSGVQYYIARKAVEAIPLVASVLDTVRCACLGCSVHSLKCNGNGNIFLELELSSGVLISCMISKSDIKLKLPVQQRAPLDLHVDELVKLRNACKFVQFAIRDKEIHVEGFNRAAMLDGLDVGVTTVNTGVSILVVDTHSQAVITKEGIDYSSNDSHINIRSIERMHKYCSIIAEGRQPNVL